MSAATTMTPLATAAPSRARPAWRKPVVISSIVLGVLGVAVVVLYFLNVLMPRYTCDSKTGNCVGKYNGAYKTNTCSNKCTSGGGGGGGSTATGGYGYDCNGNGECVRVAGGGFFGNDPGCGKGCYRCDMDAEGGGVLAGPKTSATMKKLPDAYYVNSSTKDSCYQTYTCNGRGQCMITYPTLGQFKTSSCDKGCNVCKDGTCAPVATGMMGGYIATCNANTDCGGPYSCTDNACKVDKDHGIFSTLKECNDSGCKVKATPYKLDQLQDFTGSKLSKLGNDGGDINVSAFIKLGEFTVSSDNKCTVTINASYKVGMYSGSGSDSMIASLYLVDKNAFDKGDHHGLDFQENDAYGKNMVAIAPNSGDAYNFIHSGAVIAGNKIASTDINDSELHKLQRDSKDHLIQLQGDFLLDSGFYWVVAYLGISTNDTVKVTHVPDCTASVPGLC